jgi:hypothetical protein
MACSAWEFYHPIYQLQVTVWISHVGSFLVRFVGARVQTDYTSITNVARCAFTVPAGCEGAKLRAREAPSFPSELSANVSMHTLEPGMRPYSGSYQIVESAKLAKSVTIGMQMGLLTHTLMDATNATSVKLFSVVGVGTPDARCYCVTESILSPPESVPWAATPPPTFVHRASVASRVCEVWRQTGYIIGTDNFTAAFDASAGGPVQWEWDDEGINKTKTYTNMSGTARCGGVRCVCRVRQGQLCRFPS